MIECSRRVPLFSATGLVFRRFVPAAILLAVCLTSSCMFSRFPRIRPVIEPDKSSVSRLRAEDYFIKGREYEHRGLNQMAEHFYEIAYEFDSGSTTLRNLLARQYLETGKYTQALLLIRGSSKPDSLTVEERRILAAIYIKTGQFERAADLIAVLKDKTPEELYSLGLIYESAGKSAEALRSYDEFFHRGPASIELGIKIGTLMLRLKQYQRAESLCVALEKQFGQSTVLLNFCGVTSQYKGDTAAAQNFFKMALIADSTNEEAMRNLAQISIVRNDYHTAIGYYRRLNTLPDWGEIYGRTLAMLYFYDNRFADAESLLTKLMVDAIDDYELHYYLGLVFGAQNNFAMARMEYEKAIALKNGYEDAWRQLCFLDIKEKDLDRALGDAQRFTRVQKDAPSAWRLLGMVHNTRKEYGKAETSLRKALTLDSTDASSLFELGSCFERQKHSDSAAVLFRKVLVLRPEDATTANYLGYMWADAGIKLDSSRILIARALKKDPDNGAYLDSYAWVLFRLGDVDSALLFIQKAVVKINDDPIVFEHLGDILVKKGNVAAAIKAYEKCLVLEPENKAGIHERLELLKNKK